MKTHALLFDYLTFSFPITENESLLMSEFPENLHLFKNDYLKDLLNIMCISIPSSYETLSIEHYKGMIILENELFLKFLGAYDRFGRRIHTIELKGKGLELLRSKDVDFHVLFRYIYGNKLSVSTLHITIDALDHTLFNMYDLLSRVKKGRVNTSFRKATYIDGICKGIGSGVTIYLGSKLKTHVCIYDKKKETIMKNKESLDFNYKVRFEIRLKHERTEDFIYKYLFEYRYETEALFFGVLKAFVEFKPLVTKRNTWLNWKRFVGTYEPIKLTVKKRYKPNVKRSFMNRVHIDAKKLEKYQKKQFNNYDYTFLKFHDELEFLSDFEKRDNIEYIPLFNDYFGLNEKTMSKLFVVRLYQMYTELKFELLLSRGKIIEYDFSNVSKENGLVNFTEYFSSFMDIEIVYI